MQFHELFRNNQTQPCATSALLARTDLRKLLEELRKISLCDPDPIILNRNSHSAMLCSDVDGDGAILFGELDRVREEVL